MTVTVCATAINPEHRLWPHVFTLSALLLVAFLVPIVRRVDCAAAAVVTVAVAVAERHSFSATYSTSPRTACVACLLRPPPPFST